MKKSKSLFARPIKSKSRSNKSFEYPELLNIEGMSHEGRGIAKHEGKTIFVAGALPDEQVKYQVETKHRRFDEATCIEVIKASPDRTDPKCQHYDQCGGCDLQHYDHNVQITTKEKLVLDQLSRLGKFSPKTIERAITSPSWQYRRSCRLGINQLKRDGSPIVGFRRRGSNKLTSIADCPVLAEPLNKVLKGLPPLLESAESFKEITHAELSLGDHEGAMTLRVKKQPSKELCEQLNTLATNLGFKLYLDFGDHSEAFEEEATLGYTHQTSGTQIRFQPGDFIQVNASVNQQMIDRAIEWLELTESDRVLDLFSGIGNFTLPIATTAASVVGVEGVEDMVERSRENAELNQLSNCSFYRADLSKDLTAMPWYKQGFNKILLDPPRTGALEIIQQLEQHKAEYILYVSCNPAALARDGAELIRQGYTAERFCVMDMFPQTSHVESLILFRKA